jgi:hypothetical protein
MSGAGCDLIGGYLAELGAGLRVPPAEAELILAEAEDHLRETAAAGTAAGMTGLEAQQAAISSFGPVRAVVRAHRRRAVTAGAAAMAAWKLTGLLATTVGAGGLAGIGIFAFLLLRSDPVRPPFPASAMGVLATPALTALVVYAAMAAGGLALLATRRLVARQLATRRWAGRGTAGRDPLSPAVTASCFLLASALLVALSVTGVAVLIAPITVSWDTSTPLSEGSISAAPFVPGAGVAGCLAVAVGYGVQTVLRRARARARTRCARSAAFWVRLIAAVQVRSLCCVLGQADRTSTTPTASWKR